LFLPQRPAAADVSRSGGPIVKRTRTGNLLGLGEAAMLLVVVMPAVVLAQPGVPQWPLWAGAGMVAAGLTARLWVRCHLAAAVSRAAWPGGALRRARGEWGPCWRRRRGSRAAARGLFGRAGMIPPAA
jgi:hypothetical protein